MKAVHRIRIKDPIAAMNDTSGTGGFIKHRVFNCDQNGIETPLSNKERVEYDQQRQGFPEADFHIHKDGFVKIVFTINKSSPWRFREIPLSIDPMPKTASLWRRKSNGKKAVVIFKGKGKGKWDDHKYTLHYENSKTGKTADHDPVIKNGTIPP